MNGPNPLVVFASIVRARRLDRPNPNSVGTVDHTDLDPILDSVAAGGVPALEPRAHELAAYVKRLSDIDPDSLTRDEALAFWLNLYNAGALDVARRTFAAAGGTVLRMPGAFNTPFVDIAGESLSLDGIEHGKIRRFGDPRIHGALVCGSASCPTLRSSSYDGTDLSSQLDDQMRSFLANGGARADREGATLHLSRVLLWYGADFVRPGRMPTLLPATRTNIRDAVTPWLPEDMRTWVGHTAPRVAFMEYDWALGCKVR